MKHFKYTAVDDDEALDERGVLRDGYGVRVPMMLRDGMPLRVTDAAGGTLGLHRPGYRVADNDAMRDAKQQARDEYENWLTNAWRGGARGR